MTTATHSVVDMITNKYGLPHQFENLLARDKYDPGESNITITRLLSSPRISILQAKHKDEIVTDISDDVWKLLGKCIHTVLEEGADDSDIIEQRMFMEVNGWKVSGQCDAIRTDGKQKVLMDWKFTSAYKVGKPNTEWEEQLNCYAYLAHHDLDIDIDRLQVIMILRDWKKAQAVNSNSYPQAAVHVVELPLWSREEQKKFIEEKVTYHQDAWFDHDMGNEPPLCTNEDRWKRDSTWAIVKHGGVRSVKNCETLEEAQEHHNKMKTKQDFQIIERKGEPARCVGNYCQVADFCDQFKQENQSD